MEDKVFKALSDPMRRKILLMLSERDMPAGDIASKFDISAPSVSKHLSVLKASGLINSRKSGQKIIYSLNPSPMRNILDWIYNNFGNVWMTKQ